MTQWIKGLPNVHFVFGGLDYDADAAVLTIPPKYRRADNPSMQFPKIRRIAAFKDFLKRHRCSLDKIIQLDSRDAVFMADPFDHISQGLYVSAEIYTLRSERAYTGAWVDDVHDPTDSVLAANVPTIDLIPETGAPRRRPVLCSGVVAGDGAAFETWLDAMLTLILKSRLTAGMTFHDQAFHNLLMYRYPVLMHPHSTTVVTAEDGWMTQAYDCKDHPIPFWGPANLVQASILHQYDRCGPLNTAVMEHLKDYHDGDRRPAALTPGIPSATKQPAVAIGGVQVELPPNSQRDGCPSRPPSARARSSTSAPPPRRNTVLANGAGCSIAELVLFAESCVAHVVSGACIVFRGGAEAEHDRAFKRTTGRDRRWVAKLANVHLVYEGVDYNATVPTQLRDVGAAASAGSGRAAGILDMSEGRRFAGMLASFKDYLAQHRCAFDKLIYLDVRNTFFQSDPFERMGVGLHGLAESVGLREIDQQERVDFIHDPDDGANVGLDATMRFIPESGAFGVASGTRPSPAVIRQCLHPHSRAVGPASEIPLLAQLYPLIQVCCPICGRY